MFVKIVRKVAAHFRRLLEGVVVETLPQPPLPTEDNNDNETTEQTKHYTPLTTPLETELREGGEAISTELKEKQRALIDALPLDKYEIESGGAGWEEAEKQVKKAHAKGGGGGGGKEVTVSVKAEKRDKKRKGESAEEVWKEEIGDKDAKRLKRGMARVK